MKLVDGNSKIGQKLEQWLPHPQEEAELTEQEKKV